MAELPLVSIITPSYNSVAYIERTIKSVLAQDYKNIEHIIVDGGSTDGTIDIVKKYKHLRWVSEKDSGQSNAINKGFGMAKGSIIAWLNADDLYFPDAVSKSVSYLLSHPGTAMTYADCEIIDENDKATGKIVSRNYNEFLHLAWFNVIPQPTAFFTKEAYLKAGPLDESLHFCMDWEYWVRLGRTGKLARLPLCLAKFRFIKGTKTFSQNEKFYGEIKTVCRKYGVPPHGWLVRKAIKNLLEKLNLISTYRRARNVV